MRDGNGMDIAEPLVIAFGVVVLDELGDGPA
jgi:hypothetical protein